MEQEALQISYDEIKEYLRGLEFKKGLYGVKEDAVFSSMQKLDEMYRAKIEKLSGEYDELSSKVAGLESQLAEAVTEREASAEKIASMEVLCADYELKADQMARMMVGIQDMKDTIMDKTHADAEKIMNDAYDTQREEMEKVRAEKELAKAFRRDNISELQAIKSVFKEIFRRAENAQNLIEGNIAQLEEKPGAAVLYLEDAGESEQIK